MNRVLPVLGLVVVLPLSACGAGGEQRRPAGKVAAQQQVTAKRDTYRNYADLARHEKEGRDYRRVVRAPRGARIAHIAIHGGSIEPPTSQLADYAAAQRRTAYYSFTGTRKRDNGRLHITATRFDEPKGVKLVGGMRYTVSWHAAKGDRALTYVGGRDKALVDKVKRALKAKGFKVATPPDHLDGSSLKNIANRNQRKKGLQLELTTAQREKFFKGGRLDSAWIADPRHRTPAFYAYVKAVNSILAGL